MFSFSCFVHNYFVRKSSCLVLDKYSGKLRCSQLQIYIPIFYRINFNVIELYSLSLIRKYEKSYS